jgi:hypothetical protein
MIQAVRATAGVFKLLRTLDRYTAIRKIVIYLDDTLPETPLVAAPTEGLYRVGDEEEDA